MIFYVFKTLLCAFLLIFLSCFIADVRGKTITEDERISKTEFDSSELNSKATEVSADEVSVTDTDLLLIADKCKELNCQNDGVCVMSDKEVMCKCLDGYTGDKCEKHKCDELNCQNGGVCVMSDGEVMCQCLDGHTGDKCEKHKCQELNCQNGGICVMSDGEIMCKCLDGYTGDKCEKLNLCSEVCGENPEVVCEGDISIREAINCSCRDKDKIFDQEEKKCEVKKDKCDGVNCQNNGTCYIIEEIPVCECPDGYTGDECEKDECEELNCQNGGVCVKSDGEVMCKCLGGYTGDKCEKLDLCSEVCGENLGVVCEGNISVRDAIRCSCEDKDKIFDQEEKKCKVKTDTNTCIFNYWHVSWETAAKVCDQENSSLLCYKTRKEMEDILDSFRLTANDNSKLAIWLGNRNCAREKKEMEKCLSLHVDKSGNSTWLYFENNCDEANPFVCCVDGTNVCDSVKCQNDGICNIIDGKAVCDCPIGYTGEVCEKHPCSNEPCLNGGQCVVTGTTFECICKEPYSGKFCETNLCAQYICKNNGTCRLIQGEAKCFCKEPYSGKFCDIRMDNCVTNVCENGGICRTVNGEPKCFCVEPYGGKFCNTRTDLRYNSTIFAVVYILLGLVLISVGLLISCLLCRRICLGRK